MTSQVKKGALGVGKEMKKRAGGIRTLAKASTAKTSNFNLRRG